MLGIRLAAAGHPLATAILAGVAAPALVPAWPFPARLLAPVAVGLWSIGLVLYC